MKKLQTAAILLVVLLLGGYLRRGNISAYLYYPDAYQNLLVAQSILSSHSVAGTLGAGGYFFPPFIYWTRPVYALLIAGASQAMGSREAAYAIAFWAGILAIPLAFFLARNIFKSDSAGLAAAVILALSFNHTVWGGTVMTETTGILLLLIFFVLFFRRLEHESQYADPADYLAGISFGLAVMTRYEYAILALPAGFVLLFKSPHPLPRAVNLGAGALLVVAGMVAWLFPLREAAAGFASQTLGLLLIAGKILAGAVLLFFLVRFIPRNLKKNAGSMLRFIMQGSFLSLACFVLVRVAFRLSTSGILKNYSGATSFFADDPAVSFLAFLGIALLLRKPTYDWLSVFAVVCTATLNVFYLRTNPTMERYLTHSLPFLILPAAYAALSVLGMKRGFPKALAVTGLVLLLLVQAAKTAAGYKYFRRGIYVHQSYEETAAKKIAGMHPDNNTLLIAGFPEPYYFFTRIPTNSIGYDPPFIYFSPSENRDRQVLVVEDMGMREVFPKFAQFAETSLHDRVLGSFYTGTRYAYITHDSEETHPVVLYKTTVGELETFLGNENGQ